MGLVANKWAYKLTNSKVCRVWAPIDLVANQFNQNRTHTDFPVNVVLSRPRQI